MVEYDIVYVIGNGSYDNEELRYSLRSIERNAIGLKQIFIVGKKPEFIDDSKIIFISAEDIYPTDLENKDRNQWYKLELVCKDSRLNENFLFASDDFILNKPSTWEDFIPRQCGVVGSSYLNQIPQNNWTKTRIRTLKRFKHSTYLWHPHIMQHLNKHQFLECCEAADYRHRNDVIFHTFYYNYIQAKPIKDFDTKEYHTPEKFDDNIRHISHWDIAFNYKPFKDALKTKYGNKSKYELYDYKNDYNYDFSVIIPCYNSEKYLNECIESVLANKFNGTYEIIAVDDGSTDNTLSILKNYEKKYDNFKLLIHEKNIGLGGARNTALNEVEGRFVIFLDSDDKIRNDYMEKVFGQMNLYNLDIFYIYGESFFNDKNTEQQQKRYKNYYHTKPPFPHVFNGLESLKYTYDHKDNTFSACLNVIRMDFIRQHNLKYIADIYYEDTPFNIEAAIKANRVFNTTEKLYLRRVHNESIVIQSKNFKHFHGYINAAYEMNNKIDLTVKDREINCRIKKYTVGVYVKQAVSIFELNKKSQNKMFSNMREFNYKDTLRKFNELLKCSEI